MTPLPSGGARHASGFAWVALCGLLLGAVAGPAAAGGRREQARELSWDGRYAESVTRYRELLGEAPADADLHRELGTVLLWAGREDEAIPELEWVLARDPRDTEARLSLARAHWYRGRSEVAAAHYAIALPAHAAEGAVVAEAVGALRAAGREALAEQWLARGLSLAPDDPDLRVARALSRVAAGDLGAAERELEAVLADAPEHEAARRELASLRGLSTVERAERLGWAGDYPAALRLLRGHRSTHPDDDGASLVLARFAAWSGRYGESQRAYRSLLASAPEDRTLRRELADVTSWRGQYGPARTLYEELLDEDASDRPALLGLANVHLWSGVHRPADRILRALAAEDPEGGAAEQLHALEQLRAPSAEPALSFFRDSEGFTLWSVETEARFSPRPGTAFALRADTRRAQGRVAGSGREGSNGYGARLVLEERPNQPWAYGAELGAIHYEGGGFSPRARLHVTRWLGYRNAIQLDARYEDALPEVRSIQSALEGVERATLFAVHSYTGERFDAWTRLEGGRYSDGAFFWTARTALGYTLLPRPVEVDLLALGTVGDFSEDSPLYYSPDDLFQYGGGLRVKKRFAEQLDVLLLGEVGRVHSDGDAALTWRAAPEIVWEPDARVHLALGYEHFESLRDGQAYVSDLARVALRLRWPVAR